MACRTAKVRRVADKTVKAKEQIDKLQEMIEAQGEEHKKKFFSEIDSHLTSANITDARQIDYNFAIKTEYTSEFSLDAIAGVVTSSLQAAIKATDPTVGKPATSPDAIEAYVAVVNTVAQAAKSSSKSAASLSFSMNRLSPGVFAFLYASSINIEDNETFGKEAVTTTAIYYRFMQSLDDVKHQSEFDTALIDAKIILETKLHQAALIDELASGDKTPEQWREMDEIFTKIIESAKKRLEKYGKKSYEQVLTKSKKARVSTNQQLILDSIKKMSSMGDAFKVAIERSKARLSEGYY